MQALLLNKVSSIAMCGSLLLSVPTHGVNYTTSIEREYNPSEDRSDSRSIGIPHSNVNVYKGNVFAYTVSKTKKIVPNTIILNEEDPKPVLNSGKRTVDVLPSTFSVIQRKPVLEASAWKESNEEIFVKKSNIIGTMQSDFNVTARKSRPLA